MGDLERMAEDWRAKIAEIQAEHRKNDDPEAIRALEAKMAKASKGPRRERLALQIEEARTAQASRRAFLAIQLRNAKAELAGVLESIRFAKAMRREHDRHWIPGFGGVGVRLW